MLGRMQRSRELEIVDTGLADHRRLPLVPDRSRVELLRREVEIVSLLCVATSEFLHLVAGHLGRDPHGSEVEASRADGLGHACIGDVDAYRTGGLCPRVAVIAGDDGLAEVEVEVLDLPGLPSMEVNGTGVHDRGCPATVDGADQLPGLVDDPDLAAGRRSQADRVERDAPPGPERPRDLAGIGAEDELVVEHQPPDAVVEFGPPLVVAVAEWELVGRTREVGIHDIRVLDVDHRRLRRSGEEVLRMGGEPLVELIVAGHEDGE